MGATFTGSVPHSYHTYLGPLIFDAYAKDMAARVARAVTPGASVLELAAGTGIVTRELLRALPRDAALAATDLNQAMLTVAQGHVRADPRVTFGVVDACKIPFADGAFDVIACQYGVMFFADKVGAMHEARRVLRPNGRYIFSIWDSLEHNPIPRTVHETLRVMLPANPPTFLARMPYGYSDAAEIERVARAGGFTRVEIERVGFPSVAPSAEDAARGYVEGTPVAGELAERGITDLAPYRTGAAKALAAAFGDRPCAATMRALVVTAS